MLEKYVTLKNGVKIQSIGFGTWQAADGEVAYNAVKTALECGYRHLDCAAIYRNEASLGRAVRESGIPREEIFVTSKLWTKKRGYENAKAAFAKTMDQLGLDYLDLYLIHWPASHTRFEDWKEINAETWRALEELYEEGKIKAIGVSNFMVHHLEALLETAKIVPMVNQIEFHPGFTQDGVVEYCKEKGIAVEAWSPIGSGRLLENELLAKIAEKYGKSVAQICIRFCLQNDVLPLPKSVTPSRIKENFDVLDFALSDEDMAAIAGMDICGYSGFDPDSVEF